jgi:glycosyltransferase involved in cell wall biosynthesis
MKLSIVVPMYNTSQWLERCLDSLSSQGLETSAYEIIVVNDGSTDNSEEVFAEYKKKHPEVNLSLVSQANAGLSAARNAGTRQATGDYIWWVDSDDFVEENVMAPLLERAIADNLDVHCFGLQLYYEHGDVEPYPIGDTSEGKVLAGPDFMLKVSMPPSAWAALYRRQFLIDNELEFMPNVLHEDQEFTMRAYFLAQRAAYTPTVVYNYFQREGSIMKSNVPKKTDDLVKICESLWAFLNEHTEEGTPIREFFYNRISFLFSQALSNLCRCGIHDFPGDPEKLPFYPLNITNSLPKKERYKYRLINVSVALYLSLYRKFSNKPVDKPGLKNLRTH